MKKTLDECIRQYKFYSIKYIDAVTRGNIEMIYFYNDKLCDLAFYAMYVYKVDLEKE